MHPLICETPVPCSKSSVTVGEVNCVISFIVIMLLVRTMQGSGTTYRILGAILLMVDIVIGTFIFINLIVAVAANTLASFC